MAGVTLTGAGLAAALVAPGLAAPAHRGAAAHTVHTRAVVFKYSRGHFHFVGKSATHPKIGDRFVDYATSGSGKHLVRLLSVCTLVAGSSEKSARSQCVQTLEFPNGQVSTVGGDSNSSTSVAGISGGTGAFAYATGTVTTKSGKSAATLTIRYVDTK